MLVSAVCKLGTLPFKEPGCGVIKDTGIGSQDDSFKIPALASLGPVQEAAGT